MRLSLSHCGMLLMRADGKYQKVLPTAEMAAVPVAVGEGLEVPVAASLSTTMPIGLPVGSGSAFRAATVVPVGAAVGYSSMSTPRGASVVPWGESKEERDREWREEDKLREWEEAERKWQIEIERKRQKMANESRQMAFKRQREEAEEDARRIRAAARIQACAEERTHKQAHPYLDNTSLINTHK